MKTAKILDTRKLVLLALLTAIVVVLQLLSSYFPVYPFRLALVLVPIVIGSALISPIAGGWLGLAFGAVVLITSFTSGDPFFMLLYTFNPIAAVIIVLFKGLLAGLTSGWVYRLLKNRNMLGATITAAVVCPAVNTGIFVIGMYLFFLPVLAGMGIAGAANIAYNIFIVMIGFNFLLELAINLVLSPTIVRLIEYKNIAKSE
jgi:uncharacterized membrane protein